MYQKFQKIQKKKRGEKSNKIKGSLLRAQASILRNETMAKGHKKRAKKRAAAAAAGGSGGNERKAATAAASNASKPLNDSNQQTQKVVPSPSKVIRLPSAEQAASLDKLESFPTPTKSNGKDAERTPEYVWKAPYEPGSAWADQKDSDMFKRGEKGENAPPSSMSGGKRLSMTPQSAAKESPKKLTEASPGKTEKVITKATPPSRIPDVKKVPTPKAPTPPSQTRKPSPLSRNSQYKQQEQQQSKVPTPQRKAEIERKSFIERTFTPAKDKLDQNPLIAEIVREREEAEKKKKSGEKSFLENTLANLKDNKLAAIGIGAGAVAFLVKTMGNGPQKTRA